MKLKDKLRVTEASTFPLRMHCCTSLLNYSMGVRAPLTKFAPLCLSIEVSLLPLQNPFAFRPIRGGHEKPSFRLGGGGRLQNAPSANAFL